MIKLFQLILIGLLISGVLFGGVSLLIVMWRNTFRRWQLEDKKEKNKELKESVEFVDIEFNKIKDKK